ncbi:sperm flagellar protein 1 isoform X3 [Synchiropus splendidus]|uniref:sperm flagellar protein 1 isoform X3 n=1 Tax=Synchiropus splendidus TaxID=270530 RepID=UPI00237E854A|nr:sperm flagellar protein 1 isoform X3 [Synchiropus splendidus]
MMDTEFNKEDLHDLYVWIDKIPISRPKRNITRDFSDGVMAAEVVKYFFPNLVDLHNYTPASSTQQKLSNWNLLNRKVFAKLQYNISDETMRKIVLSTSGAIEPVLIALRDKIEKKMEQSSDNKQDLEYFDTRSQEKVLSDHRHTEMTREDMKKFRKQQLSGQLYTDMEPSVRQILEEKDQAIMALQETVEILQMKVSRLEHLVQLKNMRIEDLTRHLEMYKTKGCKQ